MSVELQRTVQGYENYIQRKGIDEEVIYAMLEASTVAIKTEKDIPYGLVLTDKTKRLIDSYTALHTDGGSIWDLEAYAQKHETEYKLVNWEYDLLWLEAKERFESFMLYLEKRRPVEERFYQPRIIPLRRVANGIQDLVDDKLDELFVNCPSRVGKASPLYSKVLTPNGFIEMGEVKVGTKVISGDGSACNVIGVYPQGIKDVFRIVFSDGTSAECCKEHLWKVQTADDRRSDRNDSSFSKYRIVQLQDMFCNLKRKNGNKQCNNYSVDYVKPVQFEKKNLSINPYVLGVIIGDGYIGDRFVQVTNTENDIFEKVKSLCCGYAEVERKDHKFRATTISFKKSDLLKDLKKMGLSGKRSYDKFIPMDYLMSDVDDRLSLLQGLCDTDGSVSGAFVDYNTSSRQLAEDIVFLVRSLGGRATINESDSHYIKDGVKHECRRRYRVTLTLNGFLTPVSSKKHLKKWVTTKSVRKKFVDRIEYVGKEECQCIMVDHPDHLYVMDDFIVTHNTQIVKLGFVWYGSKFPEKSNLYTAYSDKITGGFYDGILEIMTDPTYTYADIFPENVEKKLITDGKDTTIDLIRKKTYPTFTMRSIYGTLNGACDCSGMGVSDDLFSGIEEALSLDRQITVWGKFDNNFMKRLKRKAKLINMGTRWAPLDVQGRRRNLLENKPEYKNRRWNAIVIPALNENEESNFDYPYNLGYSTEDYLMIRSSFEENDDMASWYAQDQQEPIDRHGALFTTDNMKYFNPTQDLPDRVPDRIFAAVDPAYGGGDFVAMPICYQFSTDYFVVDVVYNNGDKEITVPEVTQRIAFHLEKFAPKTAEVHFEETKTTMEYRTLCQKEWKKLNAPVNATHDAAPNNISKADRIKNHAPDIRKLYFIDRDHRTKEYNQYFQNILTFKTEGKNKHDDGIDATAQLCDMIYGRKRTRNTVIIQSPI